MTSWDILRNTMAKIFRGKGQRKKGGIKYDAWIYVKSAEQGERGLFVGTQIVILSCETYLEKVDVYGGHRKGHYTCYSYIQQRDTKRKCTVNIDLLSEYKI